MCRFEFKKGLPCKHVIEIPRDSDIIPVKNNEASQKTTKYNIISNAADLDDVYIELVPLPIVGSSVVGSVIVVGAFIVSFSVFTSVEQSNLVMANYDNLNHGYQYD